MLLNNGGTSNPTIDLVGQKHALTLFENALMDQHTADWFDAQSYSFKDWEADLFQQFLNKMIEYKESGYNFSRLDEDPEIKEALLNYDDAAPT